MKKYLKPILLVMLVLAMVFALCACTVPDIQVQNEDGTQGAVDRFQAAKGIIESGIGPLTMAKLHGL